MASPYLDYLAALQRNANATAAPPPRPDASALLDAAFGGKPAASDAHAALHAQVAAALEYFGRVTDAEPNVLAGAVPDTPPRPPRPPGPLLPAGNRPTSPEDRSRTVLIAVLDDALPHADPGLAGRFASHWAQGAPPNGGSAPLPFGREIRGADLQRLILNQRRQKRLAPDRAIYMETATPMLGAPGRVHMQRRVSHGALVLRALLDRLDRARAGPPCRFPLVGVSFPVEAVRDTSGALLPYFTLCGLLHVLATARALAIEIQTETPLPVVVNFSYGILAGAKRAGGGVFENVLNALGDPGHPIPGVGPIHLLVPMGNGRQSQSCARVEPDMAETLTLRLLPDDRTATFVEIRGDGVETRGLTVRQPGGAMLPVPPAPKAARYHDLAQGTLLRAYYDPDLVLLAFPPTDSARFSIPLVQPGDWSIEVPAGRAAVDLYVQRDDSLDGVGSGGRQARFLDQSYELFEPDGRLRLTDPPAGAAVVRRAGTVNAFAAPPHVWGVGGEYLRYRAPGRPATVPYSGLGHAGDDGDLMADSEQSPVQSGILAQTLHGGASTRVTGTSVAVPRAAADLARLISDNPGLRNNRNALHKAYRAARASALPPIARDF